MLHRVFCHALASVFLSLPLLAEPPAASPAPAASASPAPAGGASPAPTPGVIEPKAIEALRKGFAAQIALKTFRAKMRLANAPTGAGASGDIELEVVAPDRIRMKTAGMQVVVVGEKALVQMGEKWMPAPPALSKSAMNAGDPKKIEELIQNCQAARHLGVETVNGVPMETYEYLVRRKDGSSKSKFYFTVNDQLPRRIDIEADAKGQQIKSTLEYFDYGAPVTIELPAGQ